MGYQLWLHIWNELTQSAGHQLGYANMVGNVPMLTTPVLNTTNAAVTVPSQILYIPLEFWFNRNPGETWVDYTPNTTLGIVKCQNFC